MLKLIILLLLVLIPQHKQTSIDVYVQHNSDNIIKQFEIFLGDLLINSVYIHSDNLKDYNKYNKFELGRFYEPDEIIVDNRNSGFYALQIQYLSILKKIFLINSNRFVKSTIIHELGHVYFYQCKIKKIKNI